VTETDRLFVGSMPEFYDRYLAPALFEPFARLVAGWVAELGPRRVLELAAGTGVLTAAMASVMPDVAITATDLNQPMLDRAAALRSAPNVTWRQADAQDLPLPGRHKRNAFPRVMSEAVGRLLDTDEPQFVERIPHGYHDVQQIRADLAAGGFESVDELQRAIDAVTVALRTELGNGGDAITGELTAHCVIAT
jgi:SAM-dependent methyltransferase